MDDEYDKIKDDVIKHEIIRRIRSIKTLTEELSLDGIKVVPPYITCIHIIGDFDRVASMFDDEVYEYVSGDGIQVKAFEHDGVEVYGNV